MSPDKSNVCAKTLLELACVHRDPELAVPADPGSDVGLGVIPQAPAPGSRSGEAPGSTCSRLARGVGRCSRAWPSGAVARRERQMYDRVVDVPRLLTFYDEGDLLPGPRWSRRTGAERTLPRPSSANRSGPPGSACIATGAARWPGTATPSAAGRPRTRWWRSVARAARTLMLRPRGGGATIGTARPRRPDRDGRVLSADLGARHPQDRPAGRAADQRPVPSRGFAAQKKKKKKKIFRPSTLGPSSLSTGRHQRRHADRAGGASGSPQVASQLASIW